jgi:glycosyltransferase involved in cell wall biosynthesis
MPKATKDRRLKIIWSSNGHWTNSGYACFTRDLLFRLRDDGWPLAEIAFYGLDSYPVTIDGIKVYPKMADPFGADALVNHSNDFKADVNFTMQDVWTLDPNALNQLKCWIPYVPIDGDPVPPMVMDRLRYANRIISFSKYGHDTLLKYGFTSHYIREGTDPEIFKPLNDKKVLRKEMGLPEDAFIFGVVGANKENPPRKGYQEMLDAFNIFRKDHPEGLLFFHNQQIQPGNFPIIDYARYLGFQDRIFFMNQYKATWGSDSVQINKELNAFDVCLHPSQTEGFGLVIIEAQSAGIPVIVNNCMSMPELVIEGKTGEICEHDKGRWSSDDKMVFPANVESLADKMKTIYNKLHQPNTIAKDCRDWILKSYDINKIFKDEWLPFLESLQDELLPGDKIDRTPIK